MKWQAEIAENMMSYTNWYAFSYCIISIYTLKNRTEQPANASANELIAHSKCKWHGNSCNVLSSFNGMVLDLSLLFRTMVRNVFHLFCPLRKQWDFLVRSSHDYNCSSFHNLKAIICSIWICNWRLLGSLNWYRTQWTISTRLAHTKVAWCQCSSICSGFCCLLDRASVHVEGENQNYPFFSH